MLFSEKQAKCQEISKKDLLAATFRRRPVVLGSLHATVLPRPADAGKVHVATANSGEFRIGSLLVVWVLALLSFAVEAEATGVKSGHDASAVKRPATAVAFFRRQKFVWHFRVLLGFVFGFRRSSVSPALVCKFSVLFVNSQSETEFNRT